MSHVFRHPKYYKELRASQEKKTISPEESTDSEGRASSSKQQAIDETVPHCDIEEASSVKPQADKVSSRKQQASSPEQQAASDKPQAASS
jgi:hypothetical protein